MANSEICAYKANSFLEANIVKGLLVGEGIEVRLQGEHLTGAIGELPPTDIYISLWVLARFAPAAQVIVSHYMSNQKQSVSAKDWLCRQCGEVNSAQFEICWQCQHDPDEDNL